MRKKYEYGSLIEKVCVCVHVRIYVNTSAWTKLFMVADKYLAQMAKV